MVINAELLAAARAAQGRLAEAERAADLARAEFQYTVRKMHLAGGSLREIGEALDFSHQRVHQIVEEAGGGHRPRSFAPWRPSRSRAYQAHCSFCGRSQKEVSRLISGAGGIVICDGCADKAAGVLASGAVAATALSAVKPVPAEAATATCGFCGKRRDQVDGLVLAAGTTTAGATICAECLALCHEIFAEESRGG